MYQTAYCYIQPEKQIWSKYPDSQGTLLYSIYTVYPSISSINLSTWSTGFFSNKPLHISILCSNFRCLSLLQARYTGSIGAYPYSCTPSIELLQIKYRKQPKKAKINQSNPTSKWFERHCLDDKRFANNTKNLLHTSQRAPIIIAIPPEHSRALHHHVS